MFRVAFLSFLLALFAESIGAAVEPVEIAAGDILIVRTSTAERWFIISHGGERRNVLVITVTQSGDVAVKTIPLPDATGEQEPDDPDDPDDPPPPPTGLAALVRKWANEVDDQEGRMKLAAAYAATVSLIDSGQVSSVETLVALQRAANSLVLGSSASKWAGFFSRLAAHLDTNTPADLAGYKAVWTQVSEGLR